MQQGNNNLSQRKCERGRAHQGAAKAELNHDVIEWMTEAPYLEREEEHDLALKWHGEHDDDALHKIAAAHARLVNSLSIPAIIRKMVDLPAPLGPRMPILASG